MATTEKIIIEIDVQSNTLKDTEDKIKKVSGALVKLRGDEKANENQLRATEAELRLLNKTYREQDRVLQASIKANNAAEGSLEQLKAQYVVAQSALNKMSAEQRENTQEGKDQIAEVARLNAELKRIESSYGQNARNVGNYTEAVKPLRQQLRELTMQLQQLEMQGKGNSEEFRNLSAEAGRIKDTMGDVNNTIKALASDTSLIDGVATGISGVAGAFSAAQGAAALFGDENEDLQKTMVKIQATMAIANGVQQVANALQKDSALMVELSKQKTQAATAAQAIYTTVVGGTTGALKLMRIALAATGIGLAIVAIGFLIAKIVEWTEKTDDQAKSEAALKMQMEANIKAYEDTKKQIELVNDQKDLANKRNIELAKSTGATTEAVTKLELNAYKDQIKGLEELRLKAAAAYVQLSKFPAQYVSDLFKSNEKIIDAQKNVPFVISKDQVEQAQKLLADVIDINNSIADAQTKIITESNEKVIKAQEEFKKKTLDALSALNTLENKILSDNYEFRIKQLTDTYVKEGKIIEEAYKLGLVNEQQYLTDKLALQNLYSQNLRAILSADAQFQKDLTNELIAGQDLIAQNQLNKQAENEAKSLDAYKIYSGEIKNVDADKTKTLNDNADAVTAIFVQQADLINKAFVDSITENGIDLKKFSKQALSIVIDTLGKIVEVQILGATTIASANSFTTPQSALTGGAAGLAQSLLVAGIIRGLFTAFKAALLSSFEKGGIIPKAADGMLVGNRHAQGGIKIGTPSGMIEAEGGEVIINRKSVSMYKPLLSAINEAGGGVKFADGGQIYTPPVSQEFNILADMFKTMPQPVVSVVDIIDVTQKVGRIKATATL